MDWAGLAAQTSEEFWVASEVAARARVPAISPSRRSPLAVRCLKLVAAPCAQAYLALFLTDTLYRESLALGRRLNGRLQVIDADGVSLRQLVRAPVVSDAALWP